MECTEKSLLSVEGQTTATSTQEDSLGFDEDSNAEDGSFSIDAFLPKLDADPSNTGTGPISFD